MTKEILKENIKEMQSLDDCMNEICSNLNPDDINNNLDKTPKKTKTVSAKKETKETNDNSKYYDLLVKYGLQGEDAEIVVNNINNSDFYPFEKILSIKGAIELNLAKNKLNIKLSLCDFYKKLLVTMFTQNGLDLETPKQYTCEDISHFATECALIGLSPLDTVYVKPLFKTDIKPIVLLQGFEQLIIRSADKVSVTYEISSNTVDVKVPIDAAQDLDNFDETTLSWSSNLVKMPLYVKCVLHYEKDNKSYDLEGFAETKNCLKLTPFWAHDSMEMLRHVAFKRASKLLIKCPVLTADDMNESASYNREAFKLKRLEAFKKSIETIKTETDKFEIKKKILATTILNESDKNELINLVNSKNLAKPVIQDCATIVCNDEESNFDIKIPNNQDIPPILLNKSESKQIFSEIGLKL